MNKCKKLHSQCIIDNHLYYHHFQPIMDIHEERVLGYESLLRSNYVDHPESLFHAAKKLNRLFELDISSVAKAMNSFNKQRDQITTDTLLFVNIFPSTLASPAFIKNLMRIIDGSSIPPDRIVIEVNESERVECLLTLMDSILQVKQLGVQIALDDFDKGTIPLRKILELELDYIKLDKYFSDRLTQSFKKQALIKSILTYCSLNNIRIILEGIETERDLTVAKALGIGLYQGYVFGKPDKLVNHL